MFIATVLLCGCSSIKFTERSSGEVYQGVGGKMRTANGIDFWEDGEPACKYKILGVLHEGRVSKHFDKDRISTVSKAVREHGGDAIIFVGNDPQFTLVVVKYVKWSPLL